MEHVRLDSPLEDASRDLAASLKQSSSREERSSAHRPTLPPLGPPRDPRPLGAVTSPAASAPRGASPSRRAPRPPRQTALPPVPRKREGSVKKRVVQKILEK